MNLAWKLAGVVNRWMPETVLDSYEQERIPHARYMIRPHGAGRESQSVNRLQLRPGFAPPGPTAANAGPLVAGWRSR